MLSTRVPQETVLVKKKKKYALFTNDYGKNELFPYKIIRLQNESIHLNYKICTSISFVFFFSISVYAIIILQ